MRVEQDGPRAAPARTIPALAPSRCESVPGSRSLVPPPSERKGPQVASQRDASLALPGALQSPFGLGCLSQRQGNAWPGQALQLSSPLPFDQPDGCLTGKSKGRRSCPAAPLASSGRQDVSRGCRDCHIALPMAPRLPWGSKGLVCLCLFLSSIPLWCLLLLADGAQKLWRASPQGKHSGGRPEVDLGPPFSEVGSEPHCEPGQVLLILVTSAPGNRASRQVIRRTWAAREKPLPYPWQVVFLIGRSAAEGPTCQEVRQEQDHFGDILVGNYLDAYRNLTLKVLHGLRWALGRCRPSYLLKTDDDCFVNTEWLPEFLARQNSLRSGLYAGSVFPGEKRKVIRHPSSKWYVPRELYSPEEYPPYASGIGYILSLDAAVRVLRAAESVPPIPVEDAYVGILAQQAGLRPKSSARFAKQNARWRVCNFRYLAVVHSLSAAEQEVATQRMREARHACSDRPEVTRW